MHAQQHQEHRHGARQQALYTEKSRRPSVPFMQTPLFFKLLIVAALLAVAASLGVALRRLVRDRGRGTGLIKALTWRIVLSLLLFALLVAGMWAGVVVPHGVLP